jgi:hypothetical protein
LTKPINILNKSKCFDRNEHFLLPIKNYTKIFNFAVHNIPAQVVIPEKVPVFR